MCELTYLKRFFDLVLQYSRKSRLSNFGTIARPTHADEEAAAK